MSCSALKARMDKLRKFLVSYDPRGLRVVHKLETQRETITNDVLSPRFGWIKEVAGKGAGDGEYNVVTVVHIRERLR